MAVTVRQHAFSPKLADGFKDPTASTFWYARGSDDEAEVMVEALATIPSTFYNLVLKNINYENRGGGFWDIEARYEVPDYIESDGLGDEAEPPTQPASLASPIAEDARLGPEFSADTTGGTAHITQSLSTNVRKRVGDAPGDNTARDFKQAIGVTKDGVAGCDIFQGKLEFSLTLKCPFLTWGYIKTMKRLTGKTNLLPFLIFDIGEVLYLGGTPNYHGGDGWSITHKFAVAENELTLTISDELELTVDDRMDTDAEFAKYGWEYAWVDYLEAEDGGELIQKPRAVYIEQVYGYDLLGELGFGDPA